MKTGKDVTAAVAMIEDRLNIRMKPEARTKRVRGSPE